MRNKSSWFRLQNKSTVLFILNRPLGILCWLKARKKKETGFRVSSKHFAFHLWLSHIFTWRIDPWHTFQNVHFSHHRRRYNYNQCDSVEKFWKRISTIKNRFEFHSKHSRKPSKRFDQCEFELFHIVRIFKFGSRHWIKYSCHYMQLLACTQENFVHIYRWMSSKMPSMLCYS